MDDFMQKVEKEKHRLGLTWGEIGYTPSQIEAALRLLKEVSEKLGLDRIG